MGMNDQECIEKLDRISGYCCAQKDKCYEVIAWMPLPSSYGEVEE